MAPLRSGHPRQLLASRAHNHATSCAYPRDFVIEAIAPFLDIQHANRAGGRCEHLADRLNAEDDVAMPVVLARTFAISGRRVAARLAFIVAAAAGTGRRTMPHGFEL